MKVMSKLLVPALLAGLFLSACGGKEAEVPAAETPEVAAPADAPVAEVPAAETGGYVPTPEELIPGETRPVEAAPEAK